MITALNPYHIVGPLISVSNTLAVGHVPNLPAPRFKSKSRIGQYGR